MRASRSYGSVRGALSNGRSYRDPKKSVVQSDHYCGSAAARARGAAAATVQRVAAREAALLILAEPRVSLPGHTGAESAVAGYSGGVESDSTSAWRCSTA